MTPFTKKMKKKYFDSLKTKIKNNMPKLIDSMVLKAKKNKMNSLLIPPSELEKKMMKEQKRRFREKKCKKKFKKKFFEKKQKILKLLKFQIELELQDVEEIFPIRHIRFMLKNIKRSVKTMATKLLKNFYASAPRWVTSNWLHEWATVELDEPYSLIDVFINLLTESRFIYFLPKLNDKKFLQYIKLIDTPRFIYYRKNWNLKKNLVEKNTIKYDSTIAPYQDYYEQELTSEEELPLKTFPISSKNYKVPFN